MGCAVLGDFPAFGMGDWKGTCMEREQVIRMAREAGWPSVALDNLPGTEDMHRLERFAAIVEDAQAKRLHAEGMVTIGYMRRQISAEREACAKVADSGRDPRPASDPETYLPGVRTASLLTANSIAAAIRARGQECT
jgi:hypothetical protein